MGPRDVDSCWASAGTSWSAAVRVGPGTHVPRLILPRWWRSPGVHPGAWLQVIPGPWLWAHFPHTAKLSSSPKPGWLHLHCQREKDPCMGAASTMPWERILQPGQTVPGSLRLLSSESHRAGVCTHVLALFRWLIYMQAFLAPLSSVYSLTISKLMSLAAASKMKVTSISLRQWWCPFQCSACLWKFDTPGWK